MSIRGFKSKIARNIIVLLLFSAFITAVLLAVIFQRVLVEIELAHSKRVMQTIGQLWAVTETDAYQKTKSGLHQTILSVLNKTHIHTLRISDTKGRTLFQWSRTTLYDHIFAQAMDQDSIQQPNIGITWAVFWWQPRATMVTLASTASKTSKYDMAAIVDLVPVYAKLRQFNAPIIFYILINSAILTLFGLYRIFRIYLRPIDRIVQQADQYHKNEDIFFTFRREDNELNRLSSSLNSMLKRISKDKQKLKKAVASLQKANTELRQAQNEIICAEKMASVGRLAAGIAHEIGNPIGIVMGYIDLLKQTDLASKEKDDFLQRTENEIQRIDTIIRQLLNLARPKDSRLQCVSVHGVLHELIDVMRDQPMMVNIRIDIDFRAITDSVWSNAEQLRQVFLNLLINAVDAIQSDNRDIPGCIQVRTCIKEEIQKEDLNYIEIDFKDNGPGIDQDQLPNIFDPFFTTKAPGKGTGLGLSVSYIIVEKMGGTICVQSSKGKGTIFNIQLPIIPKGDKDHCEP